MIVSRHQLVARPISKGMSGDFGCTFIPAHVFGNDVIVPATLFVLIPERPAIILADGVALYLMDKMLLQGRGTTASAPFRRPRPQEWQD
ncbi:hypothetical protein B6K69_17885 (plasmid) [Fuscovulum blasticum]|nr:hypothetical protein B6K69_17885 [Fuscovulum blasticum]